MKRTFARITGLVLLLYGGWMFTINLIERVIDDNPFQPPSFMVLGFGLAGAIGGALFLLSIDGPARLRTKRYRWIGWAGMLVCAALPTSLYFVLLILVVVSSYSLFDLALRGSERKVTTLRSG